MPPDPGATEADGEPEAPASTVVWRGLLLASGVMILFAGVLITAALLRDDGGGSRDVVRRAPKTFSYTVPAGAGERVDRGEPLWDVFPDRLTVQLDDTIVIRNEDDRTHILGPFTVRPGETLTYTFTERGVYKGLCTVHGPEYDATITVV